MKTGIFDWPQIPQTIQLNHFICSFGCLRNIYQNDQKWWLKVILFIEIKTVLVRNCIKIWIYLKEEGNLVDSPEQRHILALFLLCVWYWTKFRIGFGIIRSLVNFAADKSEINSSTNSKILNWVHDKNVLWNAKNYFHFEYLKNSK